MEDRSWSPDGTSIVFSDKGSLYEVPASGGTPQLLVSPEKSGESSGGPTGLIRWPHFLPSGAGARVLVYTFGSESERTMMVHDLDTGRQELLGPGELPYYSPSGHLLYQAGPATYNLWALPFSLDRLQVTGKAFPITEHSRCPTVAADGTLTYVEYRGPPPRQQLEWLDRRGEKTEAIGQPQDGIRYLALSPDERLLAFAAWEWIERTVPSDVWVHDLTRGVRTRVTTGPDMNFRAVWSPDGEQVVYCSLREGSLDVLLRQADGTGEESALVHSARHERVADWSSDGKHIVYEVSDDWRAGRDIWYLEREESGDWEPRGFLETPFDECGPTFSPNGRYVAYVSDESGRDEVYVRAFPGGVPKVTVSRNGGTGPRWRQDGRELFYVEQNTLVAVSVSTDPTFSVDGTTRLFELPGEVVLGDGAAPYDVSADGQRFVVAEPAGEADEPSIRVVLNWFAEFRDRR